MRSGVYTFCGHVEVHGGPGAEPKDFEKAGIIFRRDFGKREFSQLDGWKREMGPRKSRPTNRPRGEKGRERLVFQIESPFSNQIPKPSSSSQNPPPLLSPSRSPAAAMEVVMIKTLADAEAAVARIGEGDAKELLVFVMESSTSLVDAAAIKAKLLNDLDGYTFLNPSMAERKKEAEKTVRRCIKSMKERFMVDVFKQAMALDEKIEKLAKKAAAPVRLVERTPAERVGDLVYTLHLVSGVRSIRVAFGLGLGSLDICLLLFSSLSRTPSGFAVDSLAAAMLSLSLCCCCCCCCCFRRRRRLCSFNSVMCDLIFHPVLLLRAI